MPGEKHELIITLIDHIARRQGFKTERTPPTVNGVIPDLRITKSGLRAIHLEVQTDGVDLEKKVEQCRKAKAEPLIIDGRTVNLNQSLRTILSTLRDQFDVCLKEPQKPRGALSFSETWDKLKKENFTVGSKHHTVRWNDKYHYYSYDKGRLKYIKLNNKVIGIAKIEDVQKKIMSELSERFIKEDTYEHWTKEDFYGRMERWYSKKKTWAGWDSEVIIIFFEVVEVYD